MSKHPSFEEAEVTKEINSVMKNFLRELKDMFLIPGKSCYSLDKLNGNSPNKLKRLMKKKGNCNIRSLIQCLYRLGFTIEIRIVPRKMFNGTADLQTTS